MFKLLQLTCQEFVSGSNLARIVSATSARFSTSASPTSEQAARSLNLESDSDSDNPRAVQIDDHSSQKVNSPRAYLNAQEEAFAPYRFVYPEFLPDPTAKWRNRVREKLERMDMLKRRSNLEIPEFYVGSILSVTVSDRNAPGKTATFVGICTEREGQGLRATFSLRNIVDGHGVEIIYDLYNPTILNIMCLRLEKRLDENLRYLRDAPPEYSTFPFDMIPELRNPDAPVPVNPVKVKLNPKPWTAKWHLWNLRGIEDVNEQLEPWQLKKFGRWKAITGFDTNSYDLMKNYRSTIPAEEQTEIYSEVHHQLAKLTASLKKQKRKRTFVKPLKTV